MYPNVGKVLCLTFLLLEFTHSAQSRKTDESLKQTSTSNNQRKNTTGDRLHTRRQVEPPSPSKGDPGVPIDEAAANAEIQAFNRFIDILEGAPPDPQTQVNNLTEPATEAREQPQGRQLDATSLLQQQFAGFNGVQNTQFRVQGVDITALEAALQQAGLHHPGAVRITGYVNLVATPVHPPRPPKPFPPPRPHPHFPHLRPSGFNPYGGGSSLGPVTGFNFDSQPSNSFGNGGQAQPPGFQGGVQQPGFQVSPQFPTQSFPQPPGFPPQQPQGGFSPSLFARPPSFQQFDQQQPTLFSANDLQQQQQQNRPNQGTGLDPRNFYRANEVTPTTPEKYSAALTQAQTVPQRSDHAPGLSLYPPDGRGVLYRPAGTKPYAGKKWLWT